MVSLFVLSSGRSLLPAVWFPLPPFPSSRGGWFGPGSGWCGSRGRLGRGFLRGASPHGCCSPGRQHGDGRGSDREGLPGRTNPLRRRAVGPAVGGAEAAPRTEQNSQGHSRAAGRGGNSSRAGARGRGSGRHGFGFPLGAESA